MVFQYCGSGKLSENIKVVKTVHYIARINYRIKPESPEGSGSDYILDNLLEKYKMDECSIKKSFKNKTQFVDSGVSEEKVLVNAAYKILYVRTGELKDVSRQRFTSMKGRVVEFRDYKVRVIGDIPRSKLRECLNAQGYPGKQLMDTLIQMVSSSIAAHGKLIELTNKAYDVSEQIRSKFNKRFCIIIAKLLLEFLSFTKPTSGDRLETLMSICLSIYSLIDHFEVQAQGIETILMASVLPFLPHQVKEVVKHISMLSQTKIMDDFTLIHKLFSLLESFLVFVCDKLNVSQSYKEDILRIFSYVGFGEKHRLLSVAKQYLDEATKSNRIYSEFSWRKKNFDLDDKLSDNPELKDWAKRCGSVADLFKKWELHMKIVRANEETSRVEPNMFVFEGNPGCGKSVMLNQVLSILDSSKYCHSIPDINEGKDFYDSYNNEDIFFMDDVGQKGISQWRTMINMISSVKMPLECAEAKLKDTKFFNSTTVIATTNSFMQLSGLCKSDGISNMEALWRRAFVFDFYEFSLKSGMFKGTIRFKHYNMHTKHFQEGFPEYLSLNTKSSKIPTSYTIREYTDDIEGLRKWMAVIIKAFEIKKRKIKQAHDIPENIRAENSEYVKEIMRDIFYREEEDTKIEAGINFMKSMKNQFGEIKPPLLALDKVETGLLNTKSKEEYCYYSAEEGEFDALKSQGVSTLDTLGVSIFSDKIWSGLKCGVGCYMGYAVGELILNMLKDEFLLWSDNWNNMNLIEYSINLGSKIQNYLGGFLFIIALLLVGAIICYYLSDSPSSIEGQGSKFETNTSGTHNSVESIMKNVYECNLKKGDEEVSCQVLISGRSLMLPSHLTPEENMKIKIFKNRKVNHIILEYTPITRVYINREYDVSVYVLPQNYPNPFKSVSSWLSKDSDIKDQLYLISGYGFRRLDNVAQFGSVVDYKFRFGSTLQVNTTKEDYAKYDVQAAGLCGSILFSIKKGILGMHVAGNPVEDFGVASRYSAEVLSNIKNCFESSTPVIKVDLEISNIDKENTSVLQFYNTGLISRTPNSSDLVQSALYGIYPVSRYPADLSKFGKNTLKEVSKKSFTPCVSLKENELKFCKLVLSSMIGRFGILSDTEVVAGNDWLAGLNKKSSNGFSMVKEKEYYIDFENKSPTEVFKKELEVIYENALAGDVDYKHLIWQEVLKDEIRNAEKEGVPRSFRVGTITQQFLVKKYFGKMVEHIMQNRGFNKIMVGCNPIKDWPLIYKQMQTGKVFAGDIKNWDGSMNAELQQLLAEHLVEHSEETNVNLLYALVSTLTNSLVVIEKDTVLTTHSMPSGSYLTAIMNSIINKLYTAVWYFRNVKDPSVRDYWESIDDYVYGDDKLNVVRKHEEVLNAITMKEFFESVGMGFTDSVKRPIETPFQDISEITFLKRSFVYHDELQQIVCPLELRVIFNTLSYYSASKDHYTVLQGKIHAVQLEFYLHPSRYELLEDFYHRMEKYKVDYQPLMSDYMKAVYKDDNCFIPVSFSNGTLYQ